MFILGMLVGIMIGMIIMFFILKNDLNEKYNAENRATYYHRRLFKIENILRRAKEDKEPAVFTVEKIEKTIKEE